MDEVIEKDKGFRKNFIWNIIGTTFNAFNSLFFMINRRLDCKGFNLFLKAVSAGITNQFEGHWKYIRR